MIHNRRGRRIDAPIALRKFQQRSPPPPDVAGRAETPHGSIGRLSSLLLLRQIHTIAKQHPGRSTTIEDDLRLMEYLSIVLRNGIGDRRVRLHQLRSEKNTS